MLLPYKFKITRPVKKIDDLEYFWTKFPVFTLVRGYARAACVLIVDDDDRMLVCYCLSLREHHCLTHTRSLP
jgi:hypothetical protein